MSPAAPSLFKKQNDMAKTKPIDIVVPMVFPSDALWQKKYNSVCGKYGRSTVSSEPERVRSWGTEKFFFRGIAKFMPWVNAIHLILDSESQVPEWLNTDEVHVVFHKDIMPEDILPTFNSQAIEMWLHNIEGLSDQFIYANDDMIACSPLKRTDFFMLGKPVIHCEEKKYDDLNGIFRTVCRQTLNMVAKDAGKTFGHGILLKDGHSYAPMLLDTLKEAVAKYGKRMKSSCTPFREGKNLIQYLYTYMQWLSGNCRDGHHTHHYFSLSTDAEKMRKVLRSGEAGVCCFNDSGAGNWKKVGEFVREELNAILGEKCKYER